MIGDQVLAWVTELAPDLRARGHQGLLQRWAELERIDDPDRMDRYLEGARQLREEARERSEPEIERLALYLMGRAQAFALDRPERSLEPLVDLLGELRRAGRLRSALGTAAELELMRAYHKIDAPGFKATLLEGLEGLWGRLRGDLLPRLELLDVWWRTAYWCRDLEVLRQGLEKATEEPLALRGSWPYWEARGCWLRGAPDEGVEILLALLRTLDERSAGDDLWRLYCEVELGLQLATAARREESAATLGRVERAARAYGDPMLHWNLARFRASHHRSLEDAAGEVAAWRGGLRVLRDLGLARLRCEFALSLGEAARRAGDHEAVEEARRTAGPLWSALRSRAELEPRWRKLESGGGEEPPAPGRKAPPRTER